MISENYIRVQCLRLEEETCVSRRCLRSGTNMYPVRKNPEAKSLSRRSTREMSSRRRDSSEAEEESNVHPVHVAFSVENAGNQCKLPG